MGLKKLQCLKTIVCLFSESCFSHFWAGWNRQEELGVSQPRPGFGPSKAKVTALAGGQGLVRIRCGLPVRIKCSLSARIK